RASPTPCKPDTTPRQTSSNLAADSLENRFGWSRPARPVGLDRDTVGPCGPFVISLESRGKRMMLRSGDPRVPLLETSIPGLRVRRGKVGDVYERRDGRLLIVATDRISAFDWVLPNGIPDKGRLLTGISEYWFENLLYPKDHHLVSTDLGDCGIAFSAELF